MDIDQAAEMVQAQRKMQSGMKVAKAGATLTLIGYILIMIPVFLCIGLVLWILL